MTRKKWRSRCLSNPEIMFSKALTNAKNRSGKRGIPFALTKEYLLDLFQKQNGRCFYSGLELNIVKSKIEKTHDPFKMTLDCVIPDLGYVEGNVVWCAYCVNALKLEMSQQDMLDVCKKIVDNLNK